MACSAIYLDVDSRLNNINNKGSIMPTGYTADIKDGISFSEFAMNCARAFGACITLRDEQAGGDKIPDRFEPSDYHLKALISAKDRLSDLESITMEEAKTRCESEYKQAESSRITRLSENKAQLSAYQAMLQQVNAWQPPSDEHCGLRDFMREQIEQSIKFDDSTDYLSKPTEIKTAEEWLEDKKHEALKNIKYHREEYAKEVERTAKRNEWVESLRNSLQCNS